MALVKNYGDGVKVILRVEEPANDFLEFTQDNRKLRCEAHWTVKTETTPKKLQFLIGEGDANYIVLSEDQALELANWLATR